MRTYTEKSAISEIVVYPKHSISVLEILCVFYSLLNLLLGVHLIKLGHIEPYTGEHLCDFICGGNLAKNSSYFLFLCKIGSASVKGIVSNLLLKRDAAVCGRGINIADILLL